jgi:hypothetical protein
MLFDLFKSAFKGGNFWLVPNNIARTYMPIEKELGYENVIEILFCSGYINGLAYVRRDPNFVRIILNNAQHAFKTVAPYNLIPDNLSDEQRQMRDRMEWDKLNGAWYYEGPDYSFIVYDNNAIVPHSADDNARAIACFSELMLNEYLLMHSQQSTFEIEQLVSSKRRKILDSVLSGQLEFWKSINPSLLSEARAVFRRLYS